MKKIISQYAILAFLLAGCNIMSTPDTTPTQVRETGILPTVVEITAPPTRDLSTLPIISLENVGNLKMAGNLLGHSGYTHVGVLFSPDRQTLASFGYEDGTIRLWDLTTGSESARFKHYPGVQAIAFSPDGNRIASGGADKIVRIWDIQAGVEQTTYEGHATGIGFKSLDWSPDGKFIAAGSRDNVIRIWETDTNAAYAVLEGHNGEVTGISFSPDGTLLASASADNTIRLWELSTKSELGILSDHGSDVGDVAFSPDGSILASISGDRSGNDMSVRFWDVASGKQLTSVETHSHARKGSISFSPDGLLLVTCGGPSSDGTINLYNAKTGDLVAVLDGGDNAIVGVSFSSDGRLIAAGNSVGVIQIWRVAME